MRVELVVDLGGRRAPAPKRPTRPVAQPNRLAEQRERKLRWLALALHVCELVGTGEADSYAEVARRCGVSRVRVSRLLSTAGMG